MTPDWKSDLTSREPKPDAPDIAPDDSPESQRIYLMQRVQFYMHAATRWCIEARDAQQRVRQLRREARGAEIIAGLLAVLLWLSFIWRNA